MKNFKQEYKNFINEFNLSNDEYEEIKNNILFNDNQKSHIFKLKYAVIILVALFISTIGIVSASQIINNLKIKTRDNLPFEESNSIELNTDVIFNKDLPSDLFIKDNYYTYEEIEKKLDYKLLKNKYFDEKLFQVKSITTNDGYISDITFSFTNKNLEVSSKNLDFNITLKTKYSKDMNYLWMGGENLKKEQYFIKSLNTESIMIKYSIFNDIGSIMADFVYNNVIYEVRSDSINYSEKTLDYAYSLNDIKNILEGFY